MTRKVYCFSTMDKHNFTFVAQFVNNALYIYKACYKTAKYILETCYYP